jgi:hypothetical protein
VETTGGALGAVIRDHLRHVVSSAWDYIPHCQLAAMSEVIACLVPVCLGCS